jgi:hypothetical protein
MASTLPTCKSPTCLDRNRMILVDESPTQWVFACEACKDINKVLSVQVRTKPAASLLIKQQVMIDRMKKGQVTRNRLGKITYFR